MYLVIQSLKCAWVFFSPLSLLVLVLIFVCVCLNIFDCLLASPHEKLLIGPLVGVDCVSLTPSPPLQRFASVLPFVPEQWQLDPLDHIEGPQVSRFCDTELHGSREFFPLFPLPPSLPPTLLLLLCSAQKQLFMLMRMEIWFTFPLRAPLKSHLHIGWVSSVLPFHALSPTFSSVSLWP